MRRTRHGPARRTEIDRKGRSGRVLDLDQRHLRHRTARRRAAAFRSGRLAAGTAPFALGLGGLLGLRRDRAPEIFEGELFEAGFIPHRDGAYMAASPVLAPPNFVGEGLLDVLLHEA